MNIFFPPFQERVFIFFFIVGAVLGLAYDLLKVKRRLFFCSNVVLLFDDIIYSLICSVILMISVFVFNNGIVRWFEFVMSGFGFVFYRFTFSRLVLTIMFFVIDCFRKCLTILILTFALPLKHLFSKLSSPLILYNKRKTAISKILSFIKHLSPLRK